MDKVAAPAAKTAGPPPRSPGKAGKPTTLLDVHEVEWITRELERLLVRETAGAGAAEGARHRRKRAEAKVVSVSPARGHEAQAKKGGFWASSSGSTRPLYAAMLPWTAPSSAGAPAGAGAASGRSTRSRLEHR